MMISILLENDFSAFKNFDDETSAIEPRYPDYKPQNIHDFGNNLTNLLTIKAAKIEV